MIVQKRAWWILLTGLVPHFSFSMFQFLFVAERMWDPASALFLMDSSPWLGFPVDTSAATHFWFLFSILCQNLPLAKTSKHPSPFLLMFLNDLVSFLAPLRWSSWQSLCTATFLQDVWQCYDKTATATPHEKVVFQFKQFSLFLLHTLSSSWGFAACCSFCRSAW